jgi:tetratricopeptide (TPR) repeat protein
VDYRRGVASSYNQLAVICVYSGRVEEALRLYRKALEIQEQVAANDPLNPSVRAELGLWSRNLGKLLRDNPRLGDPQAEYRRAAEVFDRLTRDFPDTPSYHRELVEVLMGQARLPTTPADWPDQRAMLERARLHQRRAAGLDPSNADNRRLALHLLMVHSNTLLNHGDHRAAVERLDELPEVMLNQFDAVAGAGLLAKCAELAKRDASLSAAEKAKQVDRCIAVLAKVLRAGMKINKDWKAILDAPELAPYRSHDAVRALLDEGEKQK